MAVYNIAAGDIAVHNKTLVATVVDAINFPSDPSAFEIQTNGTAVIYLTTDGSTPTVGGANTHVVPARAHRVVSRHGGDRAVRASTAAT